MKYNIVVATHHKTGTVWMASVFEAIASDLGAQYVDFWRHGLQPETLRPPFILLNHSSTFGEHSHVLDRDDVRILHLIRDPRDVVISAMHYHKRADEGWLHERVPGYDNTTYQRKLNSLATTFEQYVFEMDNSTESTIRDILQWRYDRTNCFEARYEDLRHDTLLEHWSRIISFLGFDETEREICRRRFWQNSLFGKVTHFPHRHVRSGDVAQWKREFTADLATAFIDRFPAALQVLGYETDDEWVSDLQEPRPGGLASVLRQLASWRAG